MEIWKFEVPAASLPIAMPQGAKILSAGVQGESIMIWALVIPDAKVIRRYLFVYGTGHQVPHKNHNLPLIGTVFLGSLVFHVFDGGENKL